MSQSNLIKSDAAWERFRERTGGGARARGAFMDPAVQSAKPKADVVIPEHADTKQTEYVAKRGKRRAAKSRAY